MREVPLRKNSPIFPLWTSAMDFSAYEDAGDASTANGNGVELPVSVRIFLVLPGVRVGKIRRVFSC